MLKRFIALFFTILTIFTLCISVNAKNYNITYDDLPEDLKPYMRFVKIQNSNYLYPIIVKTDIVDSAELNKYKGYVKQYIPCLEDVYNNFYSLYFNNNLYIKCIAKSYNVTYSFNYQGQEIWSRSSESFVQSKIKMSFLTFKKVNFTLGIVPYDDSKDYNMSLSKLSDEVLENMTMYSFNEIPSGYAISWGNAYYPERITYPYITISQIKGPFVKFFTDLAESIKIGFDQIFHTNGFITTTGNTILIVIGLFLAISIIAFIFKLFWRKL